MRNLWFLNPYETAFLCSSKCFSEAVAKQHEAMKRALHLANRNRELEKELKDIDQMALAVEADANSSAKMNAEKVSKYVCNAKN